MSFQTKVFNMFYKHFPSTSYQDGVGPLDSLEAFESYTYGNPWYASGSSGTIDESGSWFNFPKNTSALNYRTTRTTEAFITASYRALPWGSHAPDFLWNVLAPSWSVIPGTVSQPLIQDGQWQIIYSSNSFYRRALAGASTLGVSSYRITSSWTIYDPKMVPDTLNNYNFEIRDYVTGGGTTYALDNGYVGWPGNEGQVYISSSYRLGSDTTRETSSIDGQYFDRGPGAAITRAEVSRSLVTASLFGSSTVNPGLANFRRGLKNRRLFFPTPYSGSGTTQGTDYWLKTYTGFKANEVFTENGGIYSVEFTLKRHIAGDVYPDTGSYMNVFIHDVVTEAPTPTQRTPGKAGWYPPTNNIVTIGHQYGASPVISFLDGVTGYLYEKFSIMLVQYGFPAQLCFEVSGSLASNSYFGIIVDDINFCKLGVTTDPNYIKQESAGNFFDPTYVPQTNEPSGDLEVS